MSMLLTFVDAIGNELLVRQGCIESWSFKEARGIWRQGSGPIDLSDEIGQMSRRDACQASSFLLYCLFAYFALGASFRPSTPYREGARECAGLHERVLHMVDEATDAGDDPSLAPAVATRRDTPEEPLVERAPRLLADALVPGAGVTLAAAPGAPALAVHHRRARCAL
jgi:hypothetical protein